MTAGHLEAVGGINYAPYLVGTVWPSDSSRGVDGKPNLLEVDQMPPQQAAASLAKLLRWATNSPSGYLLELLEVGDRQEHVYRSRLGRALCARALSLSDTGEMDALFFRPSVDPNHLLARVMVAIHEHTGHDLEDVIELAAHVTNTLLRNWTVNT